MMLAGEIYRFDRFQLVPEVNELRKEGTLVHLGPQAFRLLLLMVTRPGSVISREEIQQELWGSETFVDFERGINAAIRRIRFALNDQAETPRFLQTLPRKGYCFVMPVERVAPPAPAIALPEVLPAPSRVWPRVKFALLFCAMAVTLLLTAGPHVTRAERAPRTLLVTVSQATAEPTVTELDPRSLACEMINRLDHFCPDRIRVTAPDGPADLRIDTSLWKGADGPSVDVRLTEVSSGREVWRETFRSSGEVSDFPFEVAVRVSRAMAGMYVPPAKREHRVRTQVSARALKLYLQGQDAREQPVPQRDVKEALALLEGAVKLEPRFVEAWAAIGDLWTVRAYQWTGPSRRMAIANARTALDRAIALDPGYAEALGDRGLLLMRFDRSYEEAEAMMRRAVSADPDQADVRFNLALLLGAMGRQDEAMSHMVRVRNLDPNSHMVGLGVAFLHLLGRRYPDALAEYRASLVVLREHEPVRWDVMCAAMAAGEWQDAARYLSMIAGVAVEIPPDAPDPRAELRKQGAKLRGVFAEKEKNGLDPYQIACFHALTGDSDEAFAALGRAEDSMSSMFAFVDPRLDSLRSDPRFLPHLVRFGLMH